MRHIPEDELHAYLDQALSRSQCIEIETHLAACAGCRDARDLVAALRDRTTALLASVAPRRAAPLPYAALVVRADARRHPAWRWPAVWAATFVGAALAGWGLRTALDPHSPTTRATLPTVAAIEAAPPAPDPSQPAWRRPAIELARGERSRPPTRVVREVSGPSVGETETRLAADRPTPPPVPNPVPEIPVSPALALDAGWTVATLSEAETATGGLVPLIPDLPVVAVQLCPAGPQERPLIVVTQRHGSGGLVYTVEGPVSRVAEVVAAQLGPAIRLSSSEPSRSPPDYVEEGAAFQRTSRVLAVLGSLPVETLNALAQAVVMR